MDAVVITLTGEQQRFEVRDRFDFEDRFLRTLVPPRPCREYLEHHPGPEGVHVLLHPTRSVFEAASYLEFERHCLDETHFHVMQEGKPTGFKVVLG